MNFLIVGSGNGTGYACAGMSYACGTIYVVANPITFLPSASTLGDLVSRLNLNKWIDSADPSIKLECIPEGCIPSTAVAVCWGVSAQRGVSAWGVSAHGGSSQRSVCPGYLPEGGCLLQCMLEYTPYGQNDRQV